MSSEQRATVKMDDGAVPKESRRQGGGTPLQEHSYEHLYKILVIGDFGVGEDSILMAS